MKDTLIIEHLRRGDEEAFKYIYERKKWWTTLYFIYGSIAGR